MKKKQSLRSAAWEFFQGLGKTFMLPVALLACMGLMLGIGSSFSSATTIEKLPFLDLLWLQIFFRFILTIGSFAFTYLPVMFAMAIPAGLARAEKGVAAFSGFVSYVIMHLAINFYLTESGQLASADVMKTEGQSMVLGIQTLELSVLGGIIAGVIAYLLHKRFYRISLPDSFAFFGGPRFVPIITAAVMSLVGICIPIIWPVFALVITSVGNYIQNAGALGPFLFGAGERLLLPFGLHHILVALIRFTDAGGTAVVDGSTVSGALNIFYAQLKSGVPISSSATAFLAQGKMPTFMFGLPAVALAIYHTAHVKQRRMIKGLLISGFIATFVTGITEPIEFLFLFVSPVLYGIHVVLTGLGFMVMSLLKVTIGNTDGGVLDFFIFGVMQGTETKWFYVIIVGLIWFVLYYTIFRFMIVKFKLATPGRELIVEDKDVSVENEFSHRKKGSYDAASILVALGGKDNIDTLDNCITRLRLVVTDISKLDELKLKDLGALGVIKLDDHNVQVIIGVQVASLKQQLDELI